jgi:hypothetical protein
VARLGADRLERLLGDVAGAEDREARPRELGEGDHGPLAKQRGQGEEGGSEQRQQAGPPAYHEPPVGQGRRIAVGVVVDREQRHRAIEGVVEAVAGVQPAPEAQRQGDDGADRQGPWGRGGRQAAQSPQHRRPELFSTSITEAVPLAVFLTTDCATLNRFRTRRPMRRPH